MDILLLLIGLPALLVGGEFLVRGGASLALRLGLAPAAVGVVVLGFGTSSPELVTSLAAALRDAPGIAVGNVVGSNIANILLILGISALIAPIAVAGNVPQRDLWWLGAATVVAAIVMATGDLPVWAGAGMVAALAVYIASCLRGAAPPEDLPGTGAVSISRAVGFAIAGLVLTIVGAHLLVTGSIGIARALGVSELVIGLTVVAVGTSLPELATTIVAARRGEGALALGNIIGSNIFNVFGILGLTGLVEPIRGAGFGGMLEVAALVGSAALLACLVLSCRMGRAPALALLGGYALYIGNLVVPG
ncbi:calcium/sodium antiporter [Rhodobacterales bacterium HKCCE3408]|nr:calcium/sodium antiporter [Rhodobacterales bacterium HKCCE3408]